MATVPMGAGAAQSVDWVVSTRDASWVNQPTLVIRRPPSLPVIAVDPGLRHQRIEGFGACFSELGWDALGFLREKDREEILAGLFAPGRGAGLAICRTPIGASDFARAWYSYAEEPGDLALTTFSVDRDRHGLIPFIKAAQGHRPDLRVWASPWCPPSWMKTNEHYAAAIPAPWQVGVDNGLRPDHVGAEGTDMFLQDDRYLAAYAEYFGRYVDAYRAEGIGIEMVMPQNEWNSPQIFPSCTWTPAGLARFLKHLAPVMAGRGVDVFLGTLERANPGLVDEVLADPEVRAVVRGIGVQWAGKHAVAAIHRAYPDLAIYQTEQECGDGKNDWRYARYAWSMLKHYLSHGTTAYTYWNIALPAGGLSTWGWAQNSLVVVDPTDASWRWTHEYYLLKHFSAYVQPRAHRIEVTSSNGYENQLAFLNPDGTVVIVMHNDLAQDLPVSIYLPGGVLEATLPADSFCTFRVASSTTEN